MKIIRLNFDSIDSLLAPHQLLFVMPYRCKTARVYKVSKVFWGEERYNMIVKKLDETCSLKRGITWFYTPHDTQKMYDAMEFLYDKMDIDAMLAEQPAPLFGHDDNNSPIAKILN